jgi:hypothetical protein
VLALCLVLYYLLYVIITPIGMRYILKWIYCIPFFLNTDYTMPLRQVAEVATDYINRLHGLMMSHSCRLGRLPWLFLFLQNEYTPEFHPIPGEFGKEWENVQRANRRSSHSAIIKSSYIPIPGDSWKEWGSNNQRANTYSSHSAIIDTVSSIKCQVKERGVK